MATYEDLDKDSSLHEHLVNPVSDYSTEDLSYVTKFVILAVVVAACYAYVRAHSPRSTGRAGRHGAYEKGGLP